MWDPYQYARFSAQRSRPFFDLFSQVQACTPDTVVDLGCGSGELTRFFARRWPKAQVLGIDSSPQMLEIARNYTIPGRLEFVQHDLTTWEPVQPVDLVFSNAVLHWLPRHEELIPRLARMVSPKGTLALQIPYNQDAPSHRLVREVAAAPEWKPTLGDVAERSHVRPATWYVRTLIEQGFHVDAWETVYYQILHGERPVLEWLKGTTLRPVLKQLGSEDAQNRFLEQLGQKLDEAYPRESFGTLFPFRRILLVATRSLECLRRES